MMIIPRHPGKYKGEFELDKRTDMADQKWFKDRVIRDIKKMEPRYVSLVYRFIQGLTGKGRRKYEPKD